MVDHISSRAPECAPRQAPWCADDASDIRPHFQPIVTSHGHAVYAVEALLRVPRLDIGCDVLFRRWESTGEVVGIDATMVRRVRSVVAAQHRPLVVGLNVSALTVAVAPDEYLVEVAALAAVASRVIIEVTETFPLPDVRALLRFASRCAALGVLLALDDCSPHHEFCSPEIVRRVRPHILKIDGLLFQQCFLTSVVKPLVDIIGLARSIGAAVVAEHIASREMRDWASRLGVGLLQGHYFGAASPLTTVLGRQRGAHAL